MPVIGKTVDRQRTSDLESGRSGPEIEVCAEPASERRSSGKERERRADIYADDIQCQRLKRGIHRGQRAQTETLSGTGQSQVGLDFPAGAVSDAVILVDAPFFKTERRMLREHTDRQYTVNP